MIGENSRLRATKLAVVCILLPMRLCIYADKNNACTRHAIAMGHFRGKPKTRGPFCYGCLQYYLEEEKCCVSYEVLPGESYSPPPSSHSGLTSSSASTLTASSASGLFPASSALGLTASSAASYVASSPSGLTVSSAAGLGQEWGQQASGIEAELSN